MCSILKDKAECTKSTVYTTTEPRYSDEIFSKTDITSTKSHIPEDQIEEVELISENYSESVLNVIKPLHANNNDKNVLNDVTPTKDIVISAVDSLLVELTTLRWPEVQETHIEEVQMNTLALRSVVPNENWSKKDTTFTVSHDLKDQREEVELESDNFKSILNTSTPLNANNNTKMILNDDKVTKDVVISGVDSLLVDLNNDVKVEWTTLLPPEVQETHIEEVQMNTLALRSVVPNKNWSKKDTTFTISQDLEDQREEVELESDNFKSILNTQTPLYADNNTEILLNDDKVTKDVVISAIDMDNDVKVELTTIARPEIQRTHREGVRMNTTALRREMYIKNRLQKFKHK